MNKNKRAQLGNTLATFIATILIIIILLGYVIISGAVKAVSDKGIVVAKESEVGLSNMNNYNNYEFTKVVQLKFSLSKSKNILKAMREAGYP